MSANNGEKGPLVVVIFGLFILFVGLTIWAITPEMSDEEMLARQAKMTEMANQIAKSCDVVDKLDKKISNPESTPEEIIKSSALRREYIMQNIEDKKVVRQYKRSEIFKEHPAIDKALNAPCLLNNPPNYYSSK